jgi:non-ribosomal peptide synthase protein (TIGR01720 family)
LSNRAGIAAALRALPPAEMNFLYLGQLDQVLDQTAALAPAHESSGPSRSPNGARPYLFEINAMVVGGELRVSWVYSENLHKRETVESLAQGFVEALRRIIAHCQSPTAGDYTPSDFPLAGLDEARLHGLLERVEFEVE